MIVPIITGGLGLGNDKSMTIPHTTPGMPSSTAALALLIAAAAPASASGLSIESSVEDRRWTSKPAVYPLKGQRVRLRVKAEPGDEIRWYQIVPDAETMYKNANHPWERDPYRWVGLAKIRYDREELRSFKNRSEIEIFPDRKWTPHYLGELVRSPYYRRDLGSFWFQVEIRRGERVLRSPGIEKRDRYGLPRETTRVSVRDGPGFLGWVSSFFNVPALFGSIKLQSRHYLGADCADTLVSAHAQWTGTPPEKNFNVAMLTRLYDRVSEFDLTDGVLSENLRWNNGVHAGDLVAVRYHGARSYQHIGALHSDADGDGFLSANDLVLHAGPMPLAYAKLGGGAFDGHVLVLRPPARIRETPISFSEARREATRAYARERYGRDTDRLDPRLIVVHWTGGSDFAGAFKTFDRERLSGGRTDIAAAGAVNVSAHYLIDRDGTIHRLMPDTTMARHVIGLNGSAIGIENVGGEDGAEDLTDAQLEANAWLVRDLKDRFPKIDYLIGHFEYRDFESSPLWEERDPAYRTEKIDPGRSFMTSLRGLVADLGLRTRPRSD
jgi:hypothetical protein